MSRIGEESRPQLRPQPRYLGLAPEERQYLDALIADLREGRPGDEEPDQVDGAKPVRTATPRHPDRRKFQILWDGLAIAAGLLLSCSIIYLISHWQT